MIKAVILDLDDTLTLTKEIAFIGDNEVLRRMGKPPISKELHNAHWGKHADEAVQFWAPGIDMDEFRRVYTDLIAEYVRDGKLDIIPPENLRALDELIDMGKALYVLTSRSRHEVTHLLEPDHHLAERIHTFYYRENTTHYKPDPRAFSQIESKHGLQPQECVFVGDSLSDAESAKGAGLHFIASLESGLRTRSDFAKYQVDAFIDIFPDIVGAVRKLDLAKTV